MTNRSSGSTTIHAGLRWFLAAALVLLSAGASAETIIVSSTADSGCGSLREAVANAAANDTITFGSCVDGPVTLTSGQINIDKSLTIIGPPTSGQIISGNNKSRILAVTNASAKLTLENLTLIEGRTDSPDPGCDVTLRSGVAVCHGR